MVRYLSYCSRRSPRKRLLWEEHTTQRSNTLGYAGEAPSHSQSSPSRAPCAVTASASLFLLAHETPDVEAVVMFYGLK